MGSGLLPSGAIFTAPLFTRTPPPHEELAAEESVTRLLAEAVSINPRTTLLSAYNDIQGDSLPSRRSRRTLAMPRVPALIPSLTIKMMFFAFLPAYWPTIPLRGVEMACKGETSAAPA